MDLGSIEAKTIYVVMDPATEEAILLAKPLEKEYFEGTFETVVKEMLSLEKTPYFDGYSEEQKQLVKTISGWYNEAKANPQQVKFAIQAKTRDSEPLNLGLEDLVMANADSIILEQETTGSTGAKTTYYLMDLAVAKNYVGGYYAG